MIIHDVEQGTPDWYKVRAGVPSASSFDKILTTTGKLSAQSSGYASKLIAELMLKRPLDEPIKSYWMERGKDMEENAVALYEMLTDTQTQKCGFVTLDDKSAGASPDRFAGDEGLVEIKCPAPWTHVTNLLSEKIDPDYIPQVQGQLYVTGRAWVDWFSFHPELPPSRIRTYRDEEYIAKLKSALDEFNGKMREKLSRLAEMGHYDA